MGVDAEGGFVGIRQEIRGVRIHDVIKLENQYTLCIIFQVVSATIHQVNKNSSSSVDGNVDTMEVENDEEPMRTRPRKIRGNISCKEAVQKERVKNTISHYFFVSAIESCPLLTHCLPVIILDVNG